MQYEAMTHHTPSFLIKNCWDRDIHDVKEFLRTWCIQKGSNETRILIRDDIFASDQKSTKILYVNCLDPKLKTQAMTFVSLDLNNHFSMGMTCKNSSKNDDIQYALMLPTKWRYPISTIRNAFSQYGVFEIVVKNDYLTFLNFLQYDDARKAYLDTYEGIRIESGHRNSTVMIQMTRMIDKFEEDMSDVEQDVRQMGYLDSEFVNSFISDYKTWDSFDMPKYGDEKLFSAISDYLMSRYSFVYDPQNSKFARIEKITSPQSGTSNDSDHHIPEYVAVEIEIDASILEKIANDEHENQQVLDSEGQIGSSEINNESTNLAAVNDVSVDEETVDAVAVNVGTALEVELKVEAAKDVSVTEAAAKDVSVTGAAADKIEVKENAPNAGNEYIQRSYSDMLDTEICVFEKSVFGQDFVVDVKTRFEFDSRLSVLEKRLTIKGDGINIKNRLLQIQNELNDVGDYLVNKFK